MMVDSLQKILKEFNPSFMFANAEVGLEKTQNFILFQKREYYRIDKFLCI
jgi:hypothetical protein